MGGFKMEKIKIENLSFSYQGSPRAALSNITFSAKSGEFVVVCGRSGCGKSTLLRLISPVLAPNGSQSGKIYFENREIKDLPRREQAERIGFIQQNPDNQIVCDKVWH